MHIICKNCRKWSHDGDVAFHVKLVYFDKIFTFWALHKKLSRELFDMTQQWLGYDTVL